MKTTFFKILAFFLSFLLEANLYGQIQQTGRISVNGIIEKDSSKIVPKDGSLSLAPPVLDSGDGIALYKDTHPTFAEAQAANACKTAGGVSANRCGIFTVPLNQPYSKLEIGGWIQYSHPSNNHDLCLPVNWIWSLKDPEGKAMTEPWYVSPGRTYTYCLGATLANGQCTIPSLCLTPYVKEVQYDLEHYLKENPNTTKKLHTLSYKDAAVGTKGYFAVCADGSTASEFRITGNPAQNTLNWKLRVMEDPTGANKEKYGAFTMVSNTTAGIKFDYTHPSIPPSASNSPYEEYTIELIDAANANIVVKVFKIRIYRVPLLMVHGLLSEGSSFDAMYNFFDSRKLYMKEQMLRVNYKPTNTSAFVINRLVVPNAINTTISNLLKMGIAVKEVDLVGHSMGGILSRLYQQSAVYKYDINRIITICTPHSGSHIGDLINDPNFSSTPFAPVACWFLNCGGAIDNLSVGRIGQASIIDNELNGSTRLKNPVPSHAITSTQNLATGSPDMRKAWYYLNTTPNTLFGESNDLIVPLSSQQGGLPIDCRTDFTGQEHVGAQAFGLIINRVAELLGKDPNVNLFCKTGFNPPDLNYTPLPNGLNNALIAHSLPPVIITSPLNNKIINRNSQITITASCEQAAKMSIYIRKSQTDISIHEVNTSTININVVIDSTYSVGEHEFLVVAEFGNGQISYAESKFTVTNCIDNYNPLVGEIINPYYQAKNKIVASGQLVFGQPVVMTAGQSIEFKPGFVADTYTTLEAKIKACDN